MYELQAASVPYIFAGNDVIIAAETGSGKTHSYLVPLIDKLSDPSEHSKETHGTKEDLLAYKISLVLCPNVMLCEQVVQMANCLLDDSGNPLLRAAAVCGRHVNFLLFLLSFNSYNLLSIFRADGVSVDFEEYF